MTEHNVTKVAKEIKELREDDLAFIRRMAAFIEAMSVEELEDLIRQKSDVAHVQITTHKEMIEKQKEWEEG